MWPGIPSRLQGQQEQGPCGWPAARLVQALPATHLQGISVYFRQPGKTPSLTAASVSSLTQAKQQVARSWCAISSPFCSCFLLLGDAGTWAWGHSSCSSHSSARQGCFHLCGCCICGIPNMTRKDPCWLLVVSVSLPVGTQARICMYFWSSDCGGTCKMIFSAFSFECRLPRLITVMKNSVHPVWNYICLFRPLLELMLLLLMHDFCFHVSFILLWSSPVAPDIPLKTTSPQTVIWL